MTATPSLPQWRARMRPAAWSISVKLGVALVLTALLPMVIAGYINLQASLTRVEAGEARSLEQLASTTAGRIDQFIRDSSHILAYFAWNADVIRLVGNDDTAGRTRVEETMGRLLSANGDIELLMVLDRRGRVAAASKPEYVGRPLGFREYFKEGIAGREFLSHMEVGTASGKPGLYLALPVRTGTGLIAGVAVMKMRGQAITTIVDASRNDVRTAFLIDGDGVIIHHPDRRSLYHSLAPLPADILKQIIDEKRFGVDKVDSLNLTDFWDAIRGAQIAGHAAYRSAIDGEEKIAGFSPLDSHNWTVAVSEHKSAFIRPLAALYTNALWSALAVGVVFSGIALLFAQLFLRPIRRLTAAAEAVRRGDYAHAPVRLPSQDELGALAETFNAMVVGVKERERERDIFGRVVSPEVREKLLSGQLSLGGENRRVSVLFSDIRDFSTLSEKMSPQDVVAMLNEYLTEMTEAVRPWGGYVNNFIGDAIVVVFGAPEHKAEIEWCAVAAALDMKERLETVNRRRAELGDVALKTGIGISTGKVVAGQVGSLERFLYTVIGDAVNVAARLEAMTKEVDGNPVLINAATYEGIRHRDDLLIDDLGPRPVKGRAEPVHVYGVRGHKALA
ncbi:MAG: adenylate/guanylate cyclase domain-containing protein [Rhodocyclaceae bacterium]|nr:MAG: adenylate/guanylate cyclase domain-containing protein [Rhodocyclaceae bacterium]